MKSVYKKNIWETAKSSELSTGTPCTKVGNSYGSSIFYSGSHLSLSQSTTPLLLKHPFILPSCFPFKLTSIHPSFQPAHPGAHKAWFWVVEAER